MATPDRQDTLYELFCSSKSLRQLMVDFLLPCEKLMPDSDIFQSLAIKRMRRSLLIEKEIEKEEEYLKSKQDTA